MRQRQLHPPFLALLTPPAALPTRPSCSHADLTDEQVEAARNATRDMAAGGSAAALPAAPVATFAPAPLPEATARRLLRVSEQEVQEA